MPTLSISHTGQASFSCQLQNGVVTISGRLSPKHATPGAKVSVSEGDETHRCCITPLAEFAIAIKTRSPVRVLKLAIETMGRMPENIGRIIVLRRPTQRLDRRRKMKEGAIRTALHVPVSDPQTPSRLASIFDDAYYLGQLPESERPVAGSDPFAHYLGYGHAHDIPPHPWFNPCWYRSSLPGAPHPSHNLLAHYLESGWRSGLHPHPQFDNDRYLAEHPELWLLSLSPLEHWSLSKSPHHAVTAPSTTPAHRSHYTQNRRYIPPPPDYQTDLVSEYIRRRRASNRIAFVTAIFGDYDTLRLPERLSPAIDYHLVTDAPGQGLGVFSERVLHPTSELPSPHLLARSAKLRLPDWTPDYDVVVFADANVVIRGDLERIASDFVRTNLPLGFVPHPHRNCLYHEATTCAAQGKATPSRFLPSLRQFRAEGYPLEAGLIEANFIACRPGHRAVRSFFELWWRVFLQTGAERDQLSLGYALWKSGIHNWYPLLGPGHNTRTHPGVALVNHGRYDADFYADLRAAHSST